MAWAAARIGMCKAAARVQARSMLDLKAFLDAFGLSEPVASIKFQAPRARRLAGSVNFEPLQAEHHWTPRLWPVRLQESSICSRLDFQWRAEPAHWSGTCAPPTSTVRADLLDAPSDFRLNIKSANDPDAVGGPRTELNDWPWEWQRSPAIRLAVRGQDHWKGDGATNLDGAGSAAHR